MEKFTEIIENTLLDIVLGRDSALYEKDEDTKMMYPNVPLIVYEKNEEEPGE